MNINSYCDLKVWQSGMVLARQVYLLTQLFPKHKVYGLSSHLQRAAVSISSNIAEGSARETTKEFLQFLSTVDFSEGFEIYRAGKATACFVTSR